MDVRRTTAWRDLVRWAKHNLPWTCHLCGQRIPRWAGRFHPLSYALDHKLTVRDHPQFALARDNVAPSHKRCNDYRKAKPLTPGLVLEITEKFANRTPAALNFFDSSIETLDKSEGRGVRTPEPWLPPVTVIPVCSSPRSLSVTEPIVSAGPDEPVT